MQVPRGDLMSCAGGSRHPLRDYADGRPQSGRPGSGARSMVPLPAVALGRVGELLPFPVFRLPLLQAGETRFELANPPAQLLEATEVGA